MLVDQPCLLEERDARIGLIARNVRTIGVLDREKFFGREDSAIDAYLRHRSGQRLQSGVGCLVLVLLLVAL